MSGTRKRTFGASEEEREGSICSLQHRSGYTHAHAHVHMSTRYEGLRSDDGDDGDDKGRKCTVMNTDVNTDIDVDDSSATMHYAVPCHAMPRSSNTRHGTWSDSLTTRFIDRRTYVCTVRTYGQGGSCWSALLCSAEDAGRRGGTRTSRSLYGTYIHMYTRWEVGVEWVGCAPATYAFCPVALWSYAPDPCPLPFNVTLRRLGFKQCRPSSTLLPSTYPPPRSSLGGDGQRVSRVVVGEGEGVMLPCRHMSFLVSAARECIPASSLHLISYSLHVQSAQRWCLICSGGPVR